MKTGPFAGFYAQGAACIPCHFPDVIHSPTQSENETQENNLQRGVSNLGGAYEGGLL